MRGDPSRLFAESRTGGVILVAVRVGHGQNGYPRICARRSSAFAQFALRIAAETWRQAKKANCTLSFGTSATNHKNAKYFMQ